MAGTFFNTDSGGSESGVVLSEYQVKNYSNNYSIDFEPGDAVTLLSLSDGGSVNAYPSKIVGVYEPKFYKNVFNFINFLDITSYSRLYNFTGVQASSMPDAFNSALATQTDQEIFGLADDTMDKLDVSSLIPQKLTGYTMIAVRLKDRALAGKFTKEALAQGFNINVASWNEASGFFAYIASIIQAVIYGATFLIFIIVIFILMNTLIINVLERTGEIGTLRAMGAERSFISATFLWESFILNGAAAIFGMIVSLVCIVTIGTISLPDIMQQYLTGGDTLRLMLSPRPFIEAIGLIVVVSAAATLYPIRIATTITPLKAMSDK
jgi:putative ABC transport system permease protein